MRVDVYYTRVYRHVERSELNSNATYASLQIREGDAGRMMIRARHVQTRRKEQKKKGKRNLNGGLAFAQLSAQLKSTGYGAIIFIPSGPPKRIVITILFRTSCGMRDCLKEAALVLSAPRKNCSPKRRYCAMHTESR